MAVVSGIKDDIKPVGSSGGKTATGTTSAKPAGSLGETATGTAKGVAAASGKQVASSGTQTPDYSIDYNDKRFTDVEDQKQDALDESNAAYDEMINSSDDFYQKQIDAANDYAETQMQQQQENTDFLIEQINQQKDQANQDYIKEQQGAYVDWQKQSDQYGANAEQMAASGLQNTGYSESSQVQMYNTYQNRVATARESYNKAVLNYDNSIKEAQLANNSALAEIAYNALQAELELSLEGFQYKNDLILQKMDAQRQIDETYYNRWQDVLAQMNTENAMAEEVRQYNESMAEDQRQFNESMKEDRRQFNESMSLEREQMKIAQKQWQAEYDLKSREFNESIRQFDIEIARLKKKDTQEAKQAAKQLELQKKQLEQEQKNWEKEMKEKKRQFDKSLAEEKRQYNKSYELSKKAKSNSSGPSGGITGDDDGTGGLLGNDPSEVKAPTQAQQKAYTTLETNIANMMLKGNVTEAQKKQMKEQIANYSRGKKNEKGEWIIKPNSITYEQYQQLINLMEA